MARTLCPSLSLGLGTILVCVLGVVQAPGSANQPGKKPKISGIFLQFPCPWYARVYKLPGTLQEKRRHLGELWKQDAENQKSSGFDTTIVQYTCNDDSIYLSDDVQLKDTVLKPKMGDILNLSLDSILRNSPKDTEIWVGLRHRTAWAKTCCWKVLGSDDLFVEENLAVASAVLSETAHRNFHGWYIPLEIDNAHIAPPDNAKFLNDAHDKVAELVKKLAEKDKDKKRPVAISGFWRDRKGNATFEEYLSRIETLFKDSGVKVFIFQDGVGVEDSVNDPKKDMTPAEIAVLQKRYTTLATICGKLGVRLWIDVELMVGEGEATPATNIGRLKAQLKTAQVDGVEKIVGFSGSHHLTPLGGNANADKLSEEYQKYAK